MWAERRNVLVERASHFAKAVIPPRLQRRYASSASFRRRVHQALKWAWVPALAYAFFFTDSGFASLLIRMVRIETVRRQVAELQQRRERLQQEVELRQNDHKTLERLARERYGMTYPGETLYRIYPITSGVARRLEHQQHELEAKRDADGADDASKSTPPTPVARTAHR